MIRFFIAIARLYLLMIALTAESFLVLVRLRTIEPIGTKWRWS